ncbi:MAG: hypothetical protein II800_01925 [Lachnospiraceae bacterium]|nr:hypothetical protein [Lachnospiraceae bacterium]
MERLNWHKTSNPGGRENFVVVTYRKVDEPDKTYEVRYNYIVKDGSREGERDIDNGIFYLAEIVKDENGKDTYRRVTDNEDNLDSYSKLKEAVQKAFWASEKIEAYEEAKNAVDKARQDVTALKNEIDRLQNIADPEIVADLKESLEAARTRLEGAEKDAAELKDRVEEAKKAVEEIDFSRFGFFNGTDSDTVSDPDTTNPAGEHSTTSHVVKDIIPAIPSTLVTAKSTTMEAEGDNASVGGEAADDSATETIYDTNDSNYANNYDMTGDEYEAVSEGEAQISGQVLGAVREGNLPSDKRGREGKVLGANRERLIETQKAEEIADAGESEIIKDEIDETQKIVRIADEEVALAKAPGRTGFRFGWWWLLLLLLILVIIKVIYDKYRERNEAIANANIARIEETHRDR